MSSWGQTRALLYARWLTARRGSILTLFAVVCSGIFVCGILSALQVFANHLISIEIPASVAQPVTTIDRCVSSPGSSCATLLFAPNAPRVRELVGDIIARRGGLGVRMDDDVRAVPGTQPWPLPPEERNALVDAATFIAQGDAATCDSAPCVRETALLLCIPCAAAYDNRSIAALPSNVTASVLWVLGAYAPDREDDNTYVVFTNITATAHPLNGVSAAPAVVRAMSEHFLGSMAEIDITMRSFPRAAPRLSGFDAFMNFGSTWSFLSSSLLQYVLIVEITAEKELGLRLALRGAGLRPGAYWLAWAVVSCIVAIASGLVFAVGGFATSLAFFVQTSPLALSSILILPSIAAAGWAVFFSALLRTARSAQVVGFAVCCLQLLTITVAAGDGARLVKLLFVYPASREWGIARWLVLVAVPPLPFALIFNNIAEAVTLDGGLTARAFFEPRATSVVGVAESYSCNLPSTFAIGIALFASGVLAGALGVAIDAGSNGPQGIAMLTRHAMAEALCCAARQAAYAALPTRDQDFSESDSSSLSLGGESGSEEDTRNMQASAPPLLGCRLSLAGLRVEHAATAEPFFCCRAKRPPLVALRSFTMNVHGGEAVALLGANGSGKSSTLGILTQRIVPARGTAVIADSTGGRIMGFASQTDVLFASLTPREHADLWAVLVDVKEPLRAFAAEAVLSELALDNPRERNASAAALSGGAQRRLCVALALLGEPSVIVLDEPSAGLDPASRAALVSALQKAKIRGAALLIASHDMAEAGALADRIALLSKGKLLALSSAAELAYRVRNNPWRMTMGLVEDAGAATVREDLLRTANVRARIHRDSHSLVADVALESLGAVATAAETDTRIKSLRVSAPGLEGALAALVAADEARSEARAQRADSLSRRLLDVPARAVSSSSPQSSAHLSMGSGGADDASVVAQPSPLHSMRQDPRAKVHIWCGPRAALRAELIRRSVRLLVRAPALLSMTLALPVVALALLTGAAKLAAASGLSGIQVAIPSLFFPLNAPADIPYSRPHDILARFASQRGTNDSNQSYVPRGSGCFEFYLVAAESATLEEALGSLPRVLAPPIGQLPPVPIASNATGFLASVPASWCTLLNQSRVGVPFYDARGLAGVAAIDAELLSTLRSLNAVASTARVARDPPCAVEGTPQPDDTEEHYCASQRMPDGAFLLQGLSADGPSMRATTWVNTDPESAYHRPNGISRAREPSTDVHPLPDAARAGAVDKLARALSAWRSSRVGIGDVPPATFPPLALVGTLAETRELLGASDAVESLGSVLFVVVLCAPIPALLFRAATEREAGLIDTLARLGVSGMERRVADGIVDSVLVLGAAFTFWAGGALLQLRTLTQTGASVIFTTLLLHAAALLSVVAFIGVFVRSRGGAALVGVAVGVVFPLLATVIASGVYGRTLPWSLERALPPWFYAVPVVGPQLALARILYLSFFAAVALRAPVDSSALSSGEIAVAARALALAAVAHALAAGAADSPLPRAFWDRLQKSVRYLVAGDRVPRVRQSYSTTSTNSQVTPSSGVAEAAAVVAALAHSVSRGGRTWDDVGNTHPVIFDSVRCAYGVSRVSFALPAGTAWALMGKNGAGKSTLLSVLSGVVAAVHGTARVCGHDTSSPAPADIGAITRPPLTLCPQRDALWPTLSAREHVELAVAARGGDAAEVTALLCALRLAGRESGTRASALSGGARRRLCVALALAGSPRVILLDEPSAALDGVAKRALWRALTAARRALPTTTWLIVTHDTREAEALARGAHDGVILLAAGRVRAVGAVAAVSATLNARSRVLVAFRATRRISPPVTAPSQLVGCASNEGGELEWREGDGGAVDAATGTGLGVVVDPRVGFAPATTAALRAVMAVFSRGDVQLVGKPFEGSGGASGSARFALAPHISVARAAQKLAAAQAALSLGPIVAWTVQAAGLEEAFENVA